MRLRTIKTLDLYYSSVLEEIANLNATIPAMPAGKDKANAEAKLANALVFKAELDDNRRRIVARQVDKAKAHPNRPRYDQAIQDAYRYMEVGLEPRSALKQAASDAGIEFGSSTMEQFMAYAEAKLS
jgi:hypothetical protein